MYGQNNTVIARLCKAEAKQSVLISSSQWDCHAPVRPGLAMTEELVDSVNVEKHNCFVPKAILFDLDDTIIAWDAVAEQSWQTVCDRFANQVDGITGERLYWTIREVREWYLADPERHRQSRLDLTVYRRNAVSMALARLGIDTPNLAYEIADAYGIERNAAMFVYPGAVDTLRHFRDRNIRLALVSNGTSDDQRGKLERFDLARLFECIVIEGKLGSGKPNERIFRTALENLNVLPFETWMVGDDLARDIGGAQNVGIEGVWVDWGGSGLPDHSTVKPHKIIKSISELVPPP